MATVLTGKVVSDSVDKTIVVEVDRSKTHPIYKKRYTESRKITAHDDKNQAKLGDMVEISEVKPISKTKKFTLTKVVEEAIGEGEI